MKKIIYSALSFVFSISILTGTALAAPPSHAGGGKPGGGGSGETGATTVGYDVSYPQCGRSLPTDFAFAIVGVNGGNAASGNKCLAEQLIWAQGANGATKQDDIQLYVNTANPGEVLEQYNVTTWPQDNNDLFGNIPSITNPYGETCAGGVDESCSWLYGWQRAQDAAEHYFADAAATIPDFDATIGNYLWWLDVETTNSWQESADGLYQNVATLEGMTAYFESKGADVGLYSTAYQWGVITGNHIEPGSNLEGLPNWRPSGSSIKNAMNNCSVDPLTVGGIISLTQYVKKNLDHNYSCDV